jgi:hypothetical protein
MALRKPTYECMRCRYAARDKTALKYHLMSLPRTCPALFSEISKREYLYDLGYDEEIYHCRWCGRFFTSENSQKRHHDKCKERMLRRKTNKQKPKMGRKLIKTYGITDDPIFKIIGKYDIPEQTSGSGIYLIAIGIWEGKVLLKFGSTDNISRRLEVHSREFETVEDPEFEFYPQLVYWKECADARGVEKRLQSVLHLCHFWKGKHFFFGGRAHNELFQLGSAKEKQKLYGWWDEIHNTDPNTIIESSDSSDSSQK